VGLSLRNSSNKALREFSMICIAISAGFKIYPAVFGLFWIAEKRYKEAARLVIYGVAAFFVPFIFFGGVKGFIEYIGTFMRYMGKGTYAKTNVIGNLMRMLPSYGRKIGYLIVLLWCIWIIVYMFREGFNWKSVSLLISTHTIIIPESYLYTYVFIAIPCVLFLNSMNEKNKYNFIDYVYAILFALVFTCPPLGMGTIGNATAVYRIYVIWIILLLVISIESMMASRKNS
jgi:hypothetical protein